MSRQCKNLFEKKTQKTDKQNQLNHVDGRHKKIQSYRKKKRMKRTMLAVFAFGEAHTRTHGKKLSQYWNTEKASFSTILFWTTFRINVFAAGICFSSFFLVADLCVSAIECSPTILKQKEFIASHYWMCVCKCVNNWFSTNRLPDDWSFTFFPWNLNKRYSGWNYAFYGLRLARCKENKSTVYEWVMSLVYFTFVRTKKKDSCDETHQLISTPFYWQINLWRTLSWLTVFLIFFMHKNDRLQILSISTHKTHCSSILFN